MPEFQDAGVGGQLRRKRDDRDAERNVEHRALGRLCDLDSDDARTGLLRDGAASERK